MGPEYKFKGYNIVPRFRKTDKSWSIEIEISDDQVDNASGVLLGKFKEGMMCEITIKVLASES